MTKLHVLMSMVIAMILLLSACKDEKNQAFDTEEIFSEETPVVIETIKDTTTIIETSVLRGEGPFNVMERLNIDRRLRQRILDTLANETDFTNLRVGTRFTGVFCLDTIRLLEFIYHQDQMTTHRIQIVYGDDDEIPQIPELVYVLDEKPSEKRFRLIRGTLNSSTLDAELRNMELPANIIGIATNVLACKISFRTDARKGDEFELLLQEIVFTDTIDGEIVERTLHNRTNVLFVSYSGVRAGRTRGFRFFDGDPSSSYNAHYTEDGEALIFSGLRYPLDRIHITSTYGMRRHPVTGIRAMHQGVDYRAPTGTPVYAVAEGRVVKSRYCSINGNYIAVRHRDNTTSYYLHLHRRNVQVGANVRARQPIGTSGNTGRSTGPHLHFGFKNDRGQWINPLQKRMIATPRLQDDRLENLKVQVAEIKRVYDVELAKLNAESENKQLAQIEKTGKLVGN